MKWIWLTVLIFLAGCGTATTPEAEEETAVPASPPPVQDTPTATSPPATPTPPTAADADADVLFVEATETSPNTWRFTVTVAHPDTGWEDYADGWDVVLPDGTVVLPDPDSPFTRLLLHPHETEQPFTRSQSNIEIQEGITAVTVRAHDLVDGFGGQEVVVELETAVVTDSYEVIRINP